MVAATFDSLSSFFDSTAWLVARNLELTDDVRERELEIRSMEERLGGRLLHCPKCRVGVESSFLVCPVCTTRLKRGCRGCNAPLRQRRGANE